MKRLYESILDVDIVNKANDEANKVAEYYKDVKKLYDVFWKQFAKTIQHEYNISNDQFQTTQHNQWKECDVISTEVSFIIGYDVTGGDKKKILDECANLYKSTYKSVFKKNIDSDCITVYYSDPKVYFTYHPDFDKYPEIYAKGMVFIINYNEITIGMAYTKPK